MVKEKEISDFESIGIIVLCINFKRKQRLCSAACYRAWGGGGINEEEEKYRISIMSILRIIALLR